MRFLTEIFCRNEIDFVNLQHITVYESKLRKMTTESNTTIRGFSEAYKKIPSGDLGFVRHRIMQECEWNSLATFYMKKSGGSKVKAPEWRVLNEIFSDYGIDAETGEYTKEFQA